MPDDRQPPCRRRPQAAATVPAQTARALAALLAAALLALAMAGCGSEPDRSGAPAAPEAPAAPAAGPGPAGGFRVALVTGSDYQDQDILEAVKVLEARHGRAEEGGLIRHAVYSNRFFDEMEGTVDLIVGLAEDPMTRVVAVVEGVPGTAEAFARIRSARPDVILLAAESHEDAGVIAEAADLVVNSDFVARGYLLVWAAKQMGARTLVHVSFPRHMIYEGLRRRRAVMEVAAGDLGLEFVYENSPDPAGEAGVEGSRDFIRESVPRWLEAHGPDTAFFSTSDAHALPLIERVAELGGLLVEADQPSPLAGFPEVLGVGTEGFAGDWADLLNKLEAAAAERGASGRLGTWPVSSNYAHCAALVEFGIEAAAGRTRPGDAARLMALYQEVAPGALWSGSIYVDPSLSPIPNVVMMLGDTWILGRGPLGTVEAEVPARYRAVGLSDGVPRTPPYHIAVVTGDGSQGADDVLGAREMVGRHGDALTGGLIRHLRYPGEALDDPSIAAGLLESLASDPLLKVVVINQAVPGTAEGFRRLKAARPDVFRLAGEPHEDTSVIAGGADLVLAADFISRGYLIPYAAKLLGAEALVHVSFGRHLAMDSIALRLKIMERASLDLGLAFAREEAPDPADGLGASQDFIDKSYPAWLERHGARAAFFATNDAHTEPLLRRMAASSGYFVAADIPSTLLGYPGAFNLDLTPLLGRWGEIAEVVESAVIEAGGGGRMGAWVYPLGYIQSAGLAEFGRLLAEGTATLDDTGALLESLGALSPGAKWNGSYLNDLVTGKPLRNYFLVYQDLYVFGRGYINTTGVSIPDEYYFITLGR